jgi:hypothetical protein
VTNHPSASDAWCSRRATRSSAFLRRRSTSCCAGCHASRAAYS